MFNEDWGLTWDECIERFEAHIRHFEELKKTSPNVYAQSFGASIDLVQYASDLIEILQQLRDDNTFPDVALLISHVTLRIWLRNYNKFEVHITRIKRGTLSIGLSGYESVDVPSAKAIFTIKHYLKQAQELESIYSQVEKDEIGELERELSTLPLDWVAPAALSQIFEKSLKFSGYKHFLKETERLPSIEQMINTFGEIADIVLKAQAIAREKRTAKWLAEMDENNEV